MKYKIHSQHKRGGSYEIFYGVFEDDGVTPVMDNKTRKVGNTPLDNTALDKLFADEIFPALAAPAEELIIYTKEEIESLLQEKGYLTSEEKLEDLKAAE